MPPISKNVLEIMPLLSSQGMQVFARQFGDLPTKHFGKSLEKELAKMSDKLGADLDVAMIKAVSHAADAGFGPGKLREIERTYQKISDDLRAAAESGEVAALESVRKQIQEQEASWDRINQRRRAVENFIQEEWQGSYLKGAEKAGRAFADEADDVFSKIRSGDVAGLAGKVGGGLEKGGAAAGAMGFDKLGGVLTKLGAAAGAIAGIAAVIKIFIDAESQAKEMNKALLEGAGYVDLGVGSIMEMEDTLNAARDSAIDLAREFRTDATELMQMTSAANQAGLTLREITDNFAKAGSSAESFSEFNRSALVNARMLGVTTSEVAEQMAKWAHDFGADLNEVNTQFQSIFAAAQVTGIGVKRFYTMITQATSGMAIYNVRIEEAVDLTKKFAGAIGEDAADALTQSLRQGFTAEGYTERFKRVLIAGQGDTKRIMERSAENTAVAFMDRIKDPATRKGLQEAFQSAGIGINFDLLAKGDAGELAKLGRMSEQELRKVVAGFEATDASSARQLETMIRLAGATKGGLGNLSKAMDELDMGGKMALMLQTLGDVPLSEMSARQLAAFENYAGISGEQLKQLRRLDSRLRGQFDILKDAKEKGTPLPPEQERLLAQQYGAAIDIVNGQREIVHASVDQDGNIVKSQRIMESIGDFFLAGGREQKQALEDAEMSAEDRAKAMYRNVNSVTDILKNEIINILEGIYSVLESIAKMFGAAEDLIFNPMSQEEKVIAGATAEKQFQKRMKEREAAGLETSPEEQERLRERTFDKVMEEFRKKAEKDREKGTHKGVLKALTEDARMRAAREAGSLLGVGGEDLARFSEAAMTNKLSAFKGQLSGLDPSRAQEVVSLLRQSGVANVGVAKGAEAGTVNIVLDGKVIAKAVLGAATAPGYTAKPLGPTGTVMN